MWLPVPWSCRVSSTLRGAWTGPHCAGMLGVWDLWFLVWGILLAMATVSYWRRTANEPPGDSTGRRRSGRVFPDIDPLGWHRALRGPSPASRGTGTR
jgi:hypothetical protein